MERFAKFIYSLAFIAFFLNTLNTAGAQTLVLSPPTMSFSAYQSFTAQGFAITASDNSSIAPTITVTDAGPCSQMLDVSFSSGQGAAVIVSILLLQAEGAPYGSLVCRVGVTDARLGTAQLLVTIVNGESTGPNGQFATTDASLVFTPGNPSSQGLCLLDLSNSTAVNYTATAAVTSGTDWLQITPASGTVPSGTFSCGTSTIQVQATRGALAPGKYNGTVTITPTNLGDAPPLVVPVSFTVGGNAALQVGRASVPVGTEIEAVNFNYQVGKSSPAAQTVSILSGGSRPIAFLATVAPGAPWLEIEQNGSLTPAGITLKLTPVAFTLPPTGYGAVINVSAPEASNPDCVIPVNFFINQGPLLTIGMEPTTFNFQPGGANPPSQTLTVTTADDPISFQVLVQTTTNQPWLHVSPAAGTASAASPQALSVTVNPEGLDPGVYTGFVDVTNTVITGQGSSTTYNDTVPITLNVSASAALNYAPAALSFRFQAPQQLPAPQTINLSSTAGSLPFTVVTSAVCGTERIDLREAHRIVQQPWFTVSPNNGVTQGTTNVPITINVNPEVVTSVQTCAGLVTITSASTANTIQIPVTLNALGQ